ncbi:MAG TPA: cytochrome c3 family protein [Candidatus Binatia bacterium]|nr:cytochrome c3 family protein [Candidatus Binatia bacterium]
MRSNRTAAIALAMAFAIALMLAAHPAQAQSDSATTKPPAAAPAPAATAAPKGPADQCYACHVEQDTPAATAYKNDVHHAVGVTCAGCHGGDPTTDDQDAAMSKAKGFAGVPKKDQIPAMCGKCHGPAQGPGNAFQTRFKLDNVLADFKESIHGHALAGNPKGPQCVSCHGIHEIARVTDARSPVHPTHVVDTCAKCHSDATYMRDFSPTLPVDQKEKYLTSVHGKRHAAGDPKVATCVSCHSNHRILQAKDPRANVYPTNVPKTCARCHGDAKYMAGYGIPTSQYSDYVQSVHGKALLVKTDLNAPACNSCHGNHGAAPPGVSSVIAVCGRCHQMNQELYERSAHRAVFEGKKLPGCVVCHGNHKVQPASDQIVSFDPPSPCAQCHVNTPADKAAPDIQRLRLVLDSLSTGQVAALAVLDRAENLGMDVSDARYSLKDVNQSAVQARVAIHSFKVKEVQEAARPGIAIIAQARTAGQEAVHEYGFRRQGLAVSTLIVTFLVILLWLKIRDIEKKQKEKGR